VRTNTVIAGTCPQFPEHLQGIGFAELVLAGLRLPAFAGMTDADKKS